MILAISNVCSAFSAQTVGSKVTNRWALLVLVEAAVSDHNPAKDRVPGQAFIFLPKEATGYVSAGVGKRAGVPADGYVTRNHRGRVDAFLTRDHAQPADQVAVVVYSLDAYKADPEVGDLELASFPGGTTHVVVAVLAFAGPEGGTPLTPHRFVSNLAGGNNEALTWTADEIRLKAKEIVGYDNTWCVVAD